ncbi:SDR family NAD(P)-dependent oxidoreductase [Paraburkholderia phenazinium]|uniref:SDR family NAD(P)-dependent oxidoreductase n=1 Tax=Paraburkholderia phenazinium TaxID=60549 RepID=UPI00158E301F|nr:glucose 1-dehydrogenase [Paraburkholderia phenazinium]
MLKDKVVLVTGGANGMGEAHCRLLAERGAVVVVADVNQRGEDVVADIARDGGIARFRPLDVRDRRQWQAVVDATVREFERIDGLVNNAGILVRQPAEELTVEDWDLLFDINVKGTFLGSQAVLPAMKKAGSGSIVNISSISGLVANMPGMSAYCATKGAIRLFTKGLAVDYAAYNIRVNSLHPGTIRTPMTADFERDSEKLNLLLGTTILRRLGEPREISEVLAFLLSDASSFMTGSEVTADGGFTAV